MPAATEAPAHRRRSRRGPVDLHLDAAVAGMAARHDVEARGATRRCHDDDRSRPVVNHELPSTHAARDRRRPPMLAVGRVPTTDDVDRDGARRELDRASHGSGRPSAAPRGPGRGEADPRGRSDARTDGARPRTGARRPRGGRRRRPRPCRRATPPAAPRLALADHDRPPHGDARGGHHPAMAARGRLARLASRVARSGRRRRSGGAGRCTASRCGRSRRRSSRRRRARRRGRRRGPRVGTA